MFCEATLTSGVYFRLLSEILKETNEDIEEIEYLTDGSWRPIRDDKERDRERERSNTPEYPVVDICKYETVSLYAVVLSVDVCLFFFFSRHQFAKVNDFVISF